MAATASDEDPSLKAASDPDYSAFNLHGETFSIDSSITAYRLEHGRTYHAYRDGAYWQPNDDRQNEALDIMHHQFLQLLEGKLHLAPIDKEIERALDVGCGTGIWTLDFADEYPSTTVLGIDLSPIQPNMVSPNCHFEVDDATSLWVYPYNYFDFIYIRNLLGSISDWPALYKQAFNHLKPGGWIEHCEMGTEFRSDNGTLPADSPLNKLASLFKEVSQVTKQPFGISDTMRNEIEDAGFVGVVEKVFHVPFGPWPRNPKMRELGKWSLLAFTMGIEGYVLASLTRFMGWKVDEVHVLVAQVRAALLDRNLHSYHEVRVVYAQKPFISANTI